MTIVRNKLIQNIALVALALPLCARLMRAQATVSTSPSALVQGRNPTIPAGEGTVVDQVVAIVNGELILESDVQEDKKFQAFQPFSDPDSKFDRQQAVGRLVDRTLILQQAKLQPDNTVSISEVTAQLNELGRDIPACKQYQCETEVGWKKFVEAQGFTVDELTERWRQRMQVLKFIEVRFRMGIRITSAEIREYYDHSLVPGYAKRNASAPKLDLVSERIQEILLQQQVSSLLGDWLKTLRAQGTVRVMTASGEGS